MNGRIRGKRPVYLNARGEVQEELQHVKDAAEGTTPPVIPAGDEGPGRKISKPSVEPTKDNPLGEPWITEDVAQEALTDLGEQEDAAENENETAEQDSAEAAETPPAVRRPRDPRFPQEIPPMSHSGGSID